MKKIFNLILISILLSSCSENTNNFKLSGLTKGIEDGTKLILVDPFDDNTIDSVVIVGNKFEIENKLNSYPILLVLHAEDKPLFRYIWIENNEMTFDASNVEFNKAVIKGSLTQEEAQLLENKRGEISSKEAYEKMLKVDKAYIKNNPNSIISASMLAIYSTTYGKDESIILYNKFSERNKNTKYGKIISKFIELNKETQIGEKYVDFEMNDAEDRSLVLSENLGKITLLEFWSATCGPCRKENPKLLQTYNEFKPKGFEIFAVSLDSNKKYWIDAVNEDGLPWVNVCELNGNQNSAALTYGVSGIPDNFLINENGIIIGRNLRGDDLRNKLMEIFIKTEKL